MAENKDAENSNIGNEENSCCASDKKCCYAYIALAVIILLGAVAYAASGYVPEALHFKDNKSKISNYINTMDSELVLLDKDDPLPQELFEQEAIVQRPDLPDTKAEFDKLNAELSNKIIAVLSFIEMKELAERGMPFSSELEMFSVSAEKNPEIINTIAKLETFAVKGAASFADLLYHIENWESTIVKTEARPIFEKRTKEEAPEEAQDAPIEKSTVEKVFDDVKTWGKKTLSSFISVRPINTEQLKSMRMALSNKNGDLALKVFETLSSEKQDSLADWKQELLQRTELDSTLRNLSKEFLAVIAAAVNKDTSVQKETK
ncbi:MAG: hypothetical protein FWF23_05590 [Alphaproteobacteria bacterium]|nr:hypothetical protein [Alphaproteobacteria bacterium]MCL2504922.1 hypothetical protein [Alphaproteobacteria bacterium]